VKTKTLLIIIFFFIIPIKTFSQLGGSQLIWSTLIGGNIYESAYGFKIDSIGNVFIGGDTYSDNFPVIAGAYNTKFYFDTIGDNDNVFVTKLNYEGSGLIFSTFIGHGSCFSLDIDKFGDSYITGEANISYPVTQNAYDTNSTSNTINKAFVTKLNSTGTALIYSTLLGGNKNTIGRGLAIDTFCNSFITGITSSIDFPSTFGAYDNAYNGDSTSMVSIEGSGGDVFLTKLNYNGDSLIYSTFIGGKSNEVSFNIKLDNFENAYLAGETTSYDFPITQNAFNSIYHGKRDLFVTKLNSFGSALIFSTFIGGSNLEFWPLIEIDENNNIYITGETNSNDFPITLNAYYTKSNGVHSAFITKLDQTGNALVYSTYISEVITEVHGISLDNYLNAYIIGSTLSNEFPVTINAYDTCFNGTRDCFITKINNNGSCIIYSTFLGGYNGDDGRCIILDSRDNLYVEGSTGSGNFPTTNGAFSRKFRGGDIFVSKFSLPGSNATIQIGNIIGCPGDTIEIPIYLRNSKNISDLGTTGFTADISFNASLLLPLGISKGKVLNGIRTINLNLTGSPDSNSVLERLKFIVGLGNATTTPLTLSNFVSVCGDVNINKIDGDFKLECVCHEGGSRLINPEGAISITCKPNPVNDKVQFDFETIEDGYTELFITDMLGNKLLKVFESSIHGKYSIEADLSLLCRGVYAYTLQTPTARMSRLFIMNN
jgi:hypothetical protein